MRDNMSSQPLVAQWLLDFLAKLKEAFGDRFIFVGHHES
jgi:hypothetical protein